MMKRGLRVLATVCIVVSGAFVTPVVSAEQPPDRTAVAEDLFQRAKALMAAKDFVQASSLFAESYRLDPAGGTLQNLALCYEELGKVASAYARFQELRTLSKNADPPRPDRVKLADEHIAKLTPRLSRILVLLPNEGRAKGMEIRVDDVAYQEVSWSAGILVDPGTHAVAVSAPGKRPFHTNTNVFREGAEQRVQVPPLVDAPKDPMRPEPARSEKKESTSDSNIAPRSRTAGFVVGGVGLASLGVGAVFGVLTITKNNAGRDKCALGSNSAASPGDFDPSSKRCYVDSAAWKDSNQDKDDARAFAHVANVLIPVGVVGLGLAVYFLLRPAASGASAKSATRGHQPHVVPSLGGAVLQGRF